MNKIEFVTAVRFIGWQTYQIAAGQPRNEKINEDQRTALMDSVRYMLKHPDTTPAENHDNWMRMKIEQGWFYGPVKDFEKKTHPDLVPFEDLPDIEKGKDIADAVSHRMALDLWKDMYWDV